MNQYVKLAQLLSVVMEHSVSFTKLTKLQIVTLIGFTVGGATSAYMIAPGDWRAIAAGALGGLVSHLIGQVQEAPATRINRAKEKAYAVAPVTGGDNPFGA